MNDMNVDEVMDTASNLVNLVMKTQRSESIANLAASLAVAQGTFTVAVKDKTADTGKFKYKYASLSSIQNACRKPLSDNGLAVIQIPTNHNGQFHLETLLTHSSGEWISGTIALPVNAGRMSELQAMGSAISYARRYMLASMVGVATGEDDDGQRAARPQAQTQAPAKVEAPEFSLETLLGNLNKVERIKEFYKHPLEIQSCMAEGRAIPDKSDTDGWRQLFVDARDYAFAELERKAEAGQSEPMSEAEAVKAAQSEDSQTDPDDPTADGAALWADEQPF
ncbi:MAG: hypothetical protein GY743_23440 [Planctomycetaceae bacterium]|nr:hypothetical protein [Planctomycetaceae bacterium]